MLWTLAKKDILLKLVTFRFVATYVMVVFLVFIGSLVLIKDHEYKKENYVTRVEEHKRELERAETYVQQIPYLERIPTPLASLSRGVDDLFGNRIALPGVYSPPSVFTDNTASNPFLSAIIGFDLAHVVAMVITLLALFLAFDAISGEAESGTIRLLFSYSIPKYQVLLAKYLSVSLCVSVSIISAYLIWLLTFSVNGIGLGYADWLRILISFLVSFLLASAFILLGLLVSCLTRRPSTSLIILVFAWVLLVVVLPNFNSWLATAAHPITRQPRELSEEEVHRRVVHEEPPPDPEEEDITYSRMVFHGLPPKLVDNLVKRGRTDPVLQNLMRKQYGFYTLLARFSPVEAYFLATADLVRTSVDAHLDFLKKGLEYQRIVEDWQRTKLKAYPHRSRRITNKDGKLDKQDFPHIFPFTGDEDLASTLGRISPDLLVLILLNLLFFVSAHVSFNRYEL